MHGARQFLQALAWAVLGLSSCLTARAQEFPARPVHVLVGFAAGGTTDILARLVGERLSQMWQQTVVVENRPGAGGLIAMEALARAPATGYTVGVLTFNHVVAQELLAKPSFSIESDLVPVVGLARQGNVLVVHPSVPARNTTELIAYLKSSPGKVSYASGGNGSPAHVAAELFKLMTGVDMAHVPYKGGAPALQDVAAGHVALMFAATPPALPLIKGGKLRALAVTSDTRMVQLPELPTLAESGISYDVRDWQGLVLPAGTPAAIVSKLNADVRKILESPEVQARITSLGGEAASGTPSDFNTYIKGETLKWRKVVREARISGN